MSEFIHILIERQASRRPFEVAIRSEAAHTTYRELDARAKRIASALQAQGVGRETLVGVLVDRPELLITCALGILIAGAAYMPLDPRHPTHYRDAVVAATTPQALIVSRELAYSAAPAPSILVAEDILAENASLPTAAVSSARLSGHSWACTLSTSGSTSDPKLVQLTHAGFTNYCRWAAEYLPRGNPDTLFHGSPSFGFAITSMFVPLLRGGCVATLANREIAALADAIAEEVFGFVRLTPAHVNALYPLFSGEEKRIKARCLVLGGAPLTRSHVLALREIAPAASILNHYGLTETFIGRCVDEVPRDLSTEETISIGHATSGTRAYIVNSVLEPVASGGVGEICIGGKGLARGYFGSPATTAAQFVPDPFEADGSRMYRTGDLGRERDNGAIDFLGRLDDQVKIRGARVDPSQIAGTLLEHPQISDAFVVSVDSADTGHEVRLIAFYVPTTKVRVALDVRLYLSNRLPDYMLPYAFLPVQELPLTENGKVDRSQLAETYRASAPNTDHQQPRTETQRIVAAVWAEILNLENVGLDDDYFELGVDSISAVQAAARARRHGIRFSQADVFTHTTVAKLAAVIDQRAGVSALPG